MRTHLAFATALGLAHSAAAQFEATEVSGPGAPPFLLSKTASSHEVIAGATYNVYRALPGDGFRCISSNREDATGWDRDPTTPATPGVWWYTVNADDGWGENRHGSDVPIAAPCPCSGPPIVTGTVDLELETVLTGLTQPVHVTSAPGDTARLFVVLRPGEVRLLRRGQLLPTPFLDLEAEVVTTGNFGLMSIAFHPGYASNGRFFVKYSAAPDGDSVVAEYAVSADRDVADPTSRREILRLPQPDPNHNGGLIAFRPGDGYLYVGFGDGGIQEDPNGWGQDTTTWLSKMLRVDVDGAPPYEVPADNPFVGVPGVLPEIWSIGLREPWRFSFDPETGGLFIGDVGQRCWEEVVHEPAGSSGLNHGWSLLEGDYCFEPGVGCGSFVPCGPCSTDCTPFTPPLVSYLHGGNGGDCSVIGGHVYRGCRMPGLAGAYFYTDYCTGWTRSFVLAGGVATDEREWPDLTTRFPVSFGLDGRGEMYLLADGALYRIVPR